MGGGPERRRGSPEGTQVRDDREEADLQDNNNEKRWMEHFGDQRRRQGTDDNGLARFLTLNVNSFPKLGSPKFLRIKEEVRRNDCVGFSELNKNWFKIPAQESVYNRLKRWWPHMKMKTTWLKEPDWPSTYQQGGVSLTLATDKLAKYGKDKGEDKSGLGRWAWQTLEGHDSVKTVVIQIYRPVKNTSDNGSTYMQQRAASGEEDPLLIFDQDLMETLDQFLEQRFQVILMGDFNAHLNRKGKLETQLNDRGIYDVLQKQYPGQAPGTHKRGTKPIDGIFASDTLDIEKGGYDGGMDEISDHRTLWADFTLDSMLGVQRGDLVKPKAKKLQATNPIRVSRFIRVILEQMKEHKILERAIALEADIGEASHMTPAQAEKFEGIDKSRCRATVCAENSCTKLPPNNDEFSVELKKAIGRTTISSQILRRIQNGKRVHARWIVEMKTRLGVDEHIAIPLNLAEAKIKAKEAWEEYKDKKSRAPELRSEFLDLLIQQAEEAGNLKKVRDIRQMKEREHTKDVHARIKMARGKLRGGGVRFVHKVNAEGSVETVTNKTEMEKIIMQANAAKLEAADESPIRQGELRQTITDHDYETWETILKGELDTEGIVQDTGTRQWLKYFAHTEIKEAHVPFTTDDYIASWRPIKEHTSCAPGPLHFGVFKIMHMCRPFAELQTIMARLPMQTGYTPQRWTTSVDSMLPKKEGEWRPHKLRLTSLLMPDFNHNNKILGRAAMRNAEKHGLLAKEQYGSRRNKSAAKHALNKRLLLDVLRIQRRPAVLCANDAKACYDRILHVAAFLALRRAGLKKEAIVSMLEPIRRLRHNIRTAYGDSLTSYGGEENGKDPSGICQGNGAGPAIWALVSSPLLDILRDAGYGAKLHSALEKTFFHLSGFAFVDDADTVQTGDLDEPTYTMLEKAQEELDLWENLIRTSGGGLEGDKSDFAIINYTWNEGTWQYEKKDENNKMTVRAGEERRETLKQLGPSTARRTLGVWQAIDGNEMEQTTQMTKRSTEWARSAVRSSLSRADVKVGITTSLYPSITYGMEATTLTPEQCNEVFKPIRAGVLPKAGYCRNIPSAVIHGPEKYGGIGIRDLYTIQGTEHIKAMLNDGGTQNPTGQLLAIAMTGHTLEVGRAGRLFDANYSEIEKYMTSTWIKDTLKYTWTNNITLNTGGPTLQTWREGDVLLMDAIEDTQGVTTTEADKAAFNRCRMHLQVTTLSDICTASGDNILAEAWDCSKQWESISSRAYTWPHQPRPGQRDREAWQRVLQMALEVGSRYLTIRSNMGAFHHKSRQHSKWLYNRRDESLYKRGDEGWHRWRQARQRTRTQAYKATGEVQRDMNRHWDMAVVVEPEGTDRVRYAGNQNIGGTTAQQRETMSDDGERVQRTDIQGGRNVNRATIMSLEAAKRHLPASLQWVLEHVTWPSDNGYEIAGKIVQDKGACMSDGSLKDTFGTAASVFMGVAEENRYTICNRTPGSDEDQSSFRSELCGVLANVVMINTIARIHGIEGGTVKLGCDNESALWMSFGREVVQTGDSSFDLIKVIQHALETSPITWAYLHVRGHQDADGAKILDEWALANIETDEMADAYWTTRYGPEAITRERPIPARMPGEGWRVNLGTRKVVNKIDTLIHEYTHRDRLMTYWVRTGRINDDAKDKVAWKHYKGAVQSLPRARRQWVAKHHCGFEGNNYKLHQWKQRTTPQCPRCQEIETHRHILRCQSPQATETYNNLETNFSQWLKDTTSGDIRRAVLTHLRAYRNDRVAETEYWWSDDARRASNAQRLLGPNAFPEGMIVTEWQEVQDRYIQDHQLKMNSGRWTRALVTRMWDMCWDLWDSRNAEVHRVAATRRQVIIAQLDKNVRDTHALGRSNAFLPNMEKILFRTPVREILQQTEYQKRTWMHIANQYITRDRLRVAKDREQQRMREYLQPGSVDHIVTQQRRILNRYETDMRAPTGSRRDI